LKQVVVDDEEEEDEADNNTNEQEIQQEEEIIAPMQSGNSKQHDKKMLSFVSEKNESRPRTRRAVAEASDKSNDHPNVDCEDLYTRIKRTRRSNQTKPSKC
jgi:hypothetical protein